VQRQSAALAAYGLEHRRPAHRHRNRQRQSGQRAASMGPTRAYDHRRQRPVCNPPTDYRNVDHRLPQRRAGPPGRRRPM
jgi:hypothetical protein